MFLNFLCLRNCVLRVCLLAGFTCEELSSEELQQEQVFRMRFARPLPRTPLLCVLCVVAVGVQEN